MTEDDAPLKFRSHQVFVAAAPRYFSKTAKGEAQEEAAIANVPVSVPHVSLQFCCLGST
jgi:hypothetical protein